MERKSNFQSWFSTALALVLTVGGCSSIIHKERVKQYTLNAAHQCIERQEDRQNEADEFQSKYQNMKVNITDERVEEEIKALESELEKFCLVENKNSLKDKSEKHKNRDQKTEEKERDVIKELREARNYKWIKDEIENPGKFHLNDGSDTLALARLLFGEGRGEYKCEDYLDSVSSTVLTRSQLRNRPVKRVIFESKIKGERTYHQYSCFNSWDRNYSIVKNPLRNAQKHPLDREAWEACYKNAEKSIKNGPKYQLTHYWEENGVICPPNWAYEKKFVKDKKGKEKMERVLRTPNKKFKLNGRTTNFLNLPNYYY